ncbi:MAG TPA: hypothetical protein VGL42_12505 [Opitutaceae bacterium]|jgi:hypothetical protein
MKPAVNHLWLSGFLAVPLATGGCSRPGQTSQAPTEASAAAHQDQPPHGGTVIDLGTDAYHLEMLRDAESGTLTVWVLDGELEEFIRVAQPDLALQVKGQTYELQAVPNSATGETVGNTSQFELHADWIKSTPAFKGQIGPLTIRGTRYAPAVVNFPG